MAKKIVTPSSVKPEDFFDHAVDEGSSPEMLHHIASHPETDTMTLSTAMKHPNLTPDSLKHIHGLVHSQDKENPRFDSYDKRRLSNELATHPNLPLDLLKTGNDKLSKEEFINSRHKNTAFNPRLPIDHITTNFKKHTNDFKDLGYSHENAIEAYGQHPEVTHEHLEHLMASAKTSDLQKSLFTSPKLNIDQQKKLWASKELDRDDKTSMLAHPHLTGEFLQHAHDDLRKKLTSEGKDGNAQKPSEREYGDNHRNLNDLLEHHAVPASVIEHYSKSENPELRSSAIHNPSFPVEKLHEMAEAGDKDAMSAMHGRPEAVDPKVLRAMHAKVPVGASKYGGTSEKNLIAHPSTPDDVLKERANSGAYRAQDVLNRKELSPDVLKHLVDHKSKSVALAALQHKSVTKEVVDHALKRKMKEVNQAAALHPLAPKESRYEKFLATPDTVNKGWDKLKDDPEFVRGTMDKHHEDDSTALKLLHNKHINNTDFNKIMGRFASQKAAAEAEPEKAGQHFPAQKALTQAGNGIAQNGGAIDSEGRMHVMKMLPQSIEHLDNLTSDEMQQGLDHWHGKSQATSKRMAEDLFHHPNLSPNIAKDIVGGKYGQVEPEAGGGWRDPGTKVKDTIHNNPETFNADVIKHGLSSRPEMMNDHVTRNLASSPQFNPEHWDDVIEHLQPGEGSDSHHKNIFNNMLAGMYQHPGMQGEDLKEGLKDDFLLPHALKNPNMTDDVLMDHIKKGESVDGYENNHVRTIAKNAMERGLAHKVLQETEDPSMANSVHTDMRSSERQDLFNKHLGSIVKKQKNPEIISHILRNDIQGMDPKVKNKVADSLFNHSDAGVRSAAFAHMSEGKRNEYMEKHGNTDPNIIRGFNRDQVQKLQINKDTPKDAVKAIIDTGHATDKHYEDALNHSPEAALKLIQHMTHRSKETAYREDVKPSWKKEKKDEVNKANKEKVEFVNKRKAHAHGLINAAVDKYPENDEIMKTIHDRIDSHDGPAVENLDNQMLNHPKISEDVKAYMIRNNGSHYFEGDLDNFKDTENDNMVSALARQHHLKKSTLTHMAKKARDNANPTHGQYLAEARNLGGNQEAIDHLLTISGKEGDEHSIGLGIANNESVPSELKKELYKNPHILLNSRGSGATDEHLDGILDNQAKDDKSLLAKVAGHPAATDDLRSKVVRQAGTHAQELKDAGKDETHKDHKHLQDAFSTAVDRLKDKKLHSSAQQELGKHADMGTVNNYLAKNQGKSIDEKFAESVHKRFHDGVRSPHTEALLNSRFKHPELVQKLMEDAGKAGRFDYMAKHIEMNHKTINEPVLKTAYDQLKDSSNHGNHRDQGQLLKQLIEKAHPEISSELLDSHPRLIVNAARNKKIDPARLKTAFHQSIDDMIKNNDGPYNSDTAPDVINNPHIDADDIKKAYDKIKDNSSMSEASSLREAMAKSVKTSPEQLADMYSNRHSGDGVKHVLRNPNLPKEILMQSVEKSVKEGTSSWQDNELDHVTQNPNIRLNHFTKHVNEKYPAESDKMNKGDLINSIMDGVSKNPKAHPEDLNHIYEQATKGSHVSRSTITQLIENPNTPEHVLQTMLDNGHASEDQLIEHPLIGGKIFRSKEHKFPEGVPNIQPGKEINELHYKPKQEKFKQVINMMPPEGMDWGTFKKQEPKLAGDPDIQTMFTKQPKQKLTKEAGEQHLESLPGNKFHVSYRKWDGMQQHNESNGKSTSQLVMQINNSQEHDDELAKDPDLFKLYKMAQAGSNASGHPVEDHTLAWSRIDTSNPDHWFIDEAQSDMNSSLSKALREVEEEGSAKTLQRKYGISIEQAERLIPKLQEVLRNWDKAALTGVQELAKAHGASKVSMHSGESKTAFNKPGQEVTTKYNKIYNESANAVGLTDKASYSSIHNHDKNRGHHHVWTKDFNKKEDVKKSEFTQSERKFNKAKDLLDSLIKIQIGDDGEVVQQRSIEESNKASVNKAKMKHYSGRHGLDTSFVDRLLRNKDK